MTASDQSPSSKKLQPEAQADASTDQDLTQFVDSLTDEKRLELIKVLEVSRIHTTFLGPLPHPEDFAKYASILPNAADRSLSMAENEQKIWADGYFRTSFRMKAGPEPITPVKNAGMSERL